MARDLPSLNAVRMFEAAARHGNFTRAAEQLFVTQGAVSRQIKQLEEDLDQTLFRRDGPKVELTEAGERLYRSVEEALSILRRGTLEIRRMSAAPMLTISVLPSFAAKWLVPRLGHFQEAHNDIDIRLAASYDPVDFARRPDIDLSIRFGTGSWKSVYSECIISERMFPVCSPAYLREVGSLSLPRDIAKQPLLYAIDGYDQWNDWFEAANVAPPAVQRGPQYSDELMLQQAAIEGQGVALVRSLLASDEIRAGRLHQMSEISIVARNCYYFVCPIGRETELHIGVFLEWLRGEASKTEFACENLLTCDSSREVEPVVSAS